MRVSGIVSCAECWQRGTGFFGDLYDLSPEIWAEPAQPVSLVDPQPLPSFTKVWSPNFTHCTRGLLTFL